MTRADAMARALRAAMPGIIARHWPQGAPGAGRMEARMNLIDICVYENWESPRSAAIETARVLLVRLAEMHQLGGERMLIDEINTHLNDVYAHVPRRVPQPAPLVASHRSQEGGVA